MLSEEEKKAIEMLDKFITEHKLFNIKQSDGLEKNIDIVINLITKLEKENEELKKQIRFTGERVKNKRSGSIGIILREGEVGSIQVLENISPKVINIHDSFKTLEFIDKEE